ncbi:hypothetical protein BDZ85DRAFT_318937 [Elsinoe ampelina]|uniref:Alpha/Beta hydrolase protein n=1 Tax=Elsinoe ampelina TaxID=302913 RepID=A0A6A6GDC7_9PEZI|nr:hypothetical protein BDZ85DRAFT_318937 [Elsinoe ampelina]
MPAQPPHHRHRTTSSIRHRSHHHHPRPLINFTIPSIHDDVVLTCRIYHPSSSASHLSSNPSAAPSPSPSASSLVSPATPLPGPPRSLPSPIKAAIIAHPYAPLGGTYDDPIVLACAETLLGQGYIVATFNFRGAGGSKGKTSWSGKGEVGDYTSMVGLLTHYLTALAKGREHDARAEGVLSGAATVDVVGETPTCKEADLVLCGYSYGTLILSLLPSIPSLLAPFTSPAPGTAAAEIRLRASRLAEETLRAERAAEEKGARGRERLEPGDALGVARGRGGGVVIGGEETPREVRRRSREYQGAQRMSLEHARASLEQVAGRVKRVVRRVGSGRSDVGDTEGQGREGGGVEGGGERKDDRMEDDEGEGQGQGVGGLVVRPRYLLISPLLPPISGFLSMSLTSMLPRRLGGWLHGSGDKGEGDPGQAAFTAHPTLAIFGSEDGFTGGDRLVSWSKRMQDEVGRRNKDGGGKARASEFEYLLVEEAGHFWREEGVEDIMRRRIEEWVSKLEDGHV